MADALRDVDVGGFAPNRPEESVGQPVTNNDREIIIFEHAIHGDRVGLLEDGVFLPQKFATLVSYEVLQMLQMRHYILLSRHFIPKIQLFQELRQ